MYFADLTVQLNLQWLAGQTGRTDDPWCLSSVVDLSSAIEVLLEKGIHPHFKDVHRSIAETQVHCVNYKL